jgi:hypothetical protein
MTTGASLLLGELARLDDRAPAGRAAVMRNERCGANGAGCSERMRVVGLSLVSG